MTIRMWALALLCIAWPGTSFADTGILLLAHKGTTEWNAQVSRLVVEVDKHRPAELALGAGTRAMIQGAVDRLVKRGVSEIVAVPFLVASPNSWIAPPEYLQGYSVPIRTRPASVDHRVVSEILLSRAQEISRNPADEVLVLVGYGAKDGDTAWAINLRPVAQQLNASRRYAVIVPLAMTDPPPTPPEREKVRRTLQRYTASGRRILVVPVMMSSGKSDPSVDPWLEGLSYEMAKAGLMPDERLVDWVLSSAGK